MNKIIVYTGNNCGFCKMAKDFLKHKNAEYEEINVDEHPTMNRTWLQQLTGATSVPVITRGELVSIGYNPQKLTQLTKG